MQHGTVGGIPSSSLELYRSFVFGGNVASLMLGLSALQVSEEMLGTEIGQALQILISALQGHVSQKKRVDVK